MNSVSRLLINLSLLLDDLASLGRDSCKSDTHMKLLLEYQDILNQLTEHLAHVTDTSFRKAVKAATLKSVLPTAKMVEVHNKIITNVVTIWQSEQKAEAILNDQFDAQADKRLNLLQTRAIKSRAQLREIALVLGARDYQKVCHALALHDVG